MLVLMKIALFFSRLLALYSFIIWIRIFLTWINPYPRVGSFTYYIAKIVDPYLSVFRSSKAQIGMLDFSPVIAIGLLSVVESVLTVFGYYGRVTFGIILAQVISAFWGYGVSIFLWLAIITLIFRTIASFSSNPAFYNAQQGFGMIGNPIITFVRRCFGPRIVRERTINIISLIVAIMLYFVLKRIFEILTIQALRIPF